jgi:hypothetical protein
MRFALIPTPPARISAFRFLLLIPTTDPVDVTLDERQIRIYQ